jgi:hypothetical protein
MGPAKTRDGDLHLIHGSEAVMANDESWPLVTREDRL